MADQRASRRRVAVGWDDDPVVAAWAGRPPLAADTTADACVVGLGGSGLAVIEALVERGLSVIGVDAGRVPPALTTSTPWESGT